MPITRKTVIDQIEIRRDGTTNIRFGLLLIEDGQEIDCKWHRTIIPPGGNVDAQIAAVEVHLQQLGHPVVDAQEKARTRAAVTAARAAR